MKVRYLDLQAQFNDEALRAAIKEQFELCQFVMGPVVEEFEGNFARLCQTSHAVGLNSGTDALFLALKALGIGPGDEVITVPNSFIASAGAIVAAGARPVFVDVGEDYNMDVELIEGAITPKTRAILPVHLTGNPADMPAVMEIAGRKNLHVVEDASQSVTATINGKAVGSFGAAGCFSLHPLKNLNACGDAGVLTTNSGDVYQDVRLLRNHGLKNRDEIEFFGFNSRMDSIHAAVVNHIMKGLGAVTEARRENAALYDGELSDVGEVTIPPRKKGVEQVYHTYVIQVKDREGLIRYLAEGGVETKIHYPVPIHLQKPCLEMGYRRGDFPVCERQMEAILTLPVHQHLTREQILYVSDLIRKFYKEN
jgi:dTDP-4-amino-4,6-dideoxygalactose transaminase